VRAPPRLIVEYDSELDPDTLRLQPDDFSPVALIMPWCGPTGWSWRFIADGELSAGGKKNPLCAQVLNSFLEFTVLGETIGIQGLVGLEEPAKVLPPAAVSSQIISLSLSSPPHPAPY